MDAHFPIGRLQRPEVLNDSDWQVWLQHFHSFNSDMQELFQRIQLSDYPKTYAADSWTVQQLAFHIADAHNHGFLRFRYALTEDAPTIMPFEQEHWAKLADHHLPITVALQEFIATNTRWLAVLDNLSLGQRERPLIHPAEGRQPIWSLVCKHQWHVRHHIAHINIALQQ